MLLFMFILATYYLARAPPKISSKMDLNGAILAPQKWHRACKNAINSVIFFVFYIPFLLKDRPVGSSAFLLGNKIAALTLDG